MTAVRVSIVGVTGYTGQELLRLCLGHPGVRVVGLHASSATAAGSATAGGLLPWCRGVCELPVAGSGAAEILSARPDAVLLALPHEASAGLAGELVEGGPVVLDLSGAYRLGEADYPEHYGFDHPRADLLAEAVYGLVELPGVRERLRGARLVSVPGCYTTASIVALSPLVRGGAVKPASWGGRRPIVDAMSGVSGAGRGAKVGNLFCEVTLRPYGVMNHRHAPEIARYLASPDGTGSATPVWFTPHVGPWDRGIVATCHAELAAGWDAGRVRAALESAYAGERFVRVLPDGAWPSVGAVARTNLVELGVAVDEAEGHAIVVSALDNLTKGAAGQAVQCLNVRFGLDESAGLGLGLELVAGAGVGGVGAGA